MTTADGQELLLTETSPGHYTITPIDGESADPASVAGDVRDYAERAFRRCCETV